MIRRRWRLLLALTLLLLAGGLALVPGVRWPVYGWLRGEAFYQGRPTSYWRFTHFVFCQSDARVPDRYGESARLLTLPSAPSAHALAKMSAPRLAKCGV